MSSQSRLAQHFMNINTGAFCHPPYVSVPASSHSTLPNARYSGILGQEQPFGSSALSVFLSFSLPNTLIVASSTAPQVI